SEPAEDQVGTLVAILRGAFHTALGPLAATKAHIVTTAESAQYVWRSRHRGAADQPFTSGLDLSKKAVVVNAILYLDCGVSGVGVALGGLDSPVSCFADLVLFHSVCIPARNYAEDVRHDLDGDMRRRARCANQVVQGGQGQTGCMENDEI